MNLNDWTFGLKYAGVVIIIVAFILPMFIYSLKCGVLVKTQLQELVDNPSSVSETIEYVCDPSKSWFFNSVHYSKSFVIRNGYIFLLSFCFLTFTLASAHGDSFL